jgi:protein-tyrosine kinase
MSRLFEALSALKAEQQRAAMSNPAIAPPVVVLPTLKPEPKADYHTLQVVPPVSGSVAVAETEPEPEMIESREALPKPAAAQENVVRVRAGAESRLVTLTDPSSLGAEKFRALVTRFDHMRSQGPLKSFQVTSSVINEGKTLVAGNVAVTLAKYFGSRTLLIEGDLHRPTLANLFGLRGLPGISRWWSEGTSEIGRFVHRLEGLPLWFLPAGRACDQPSEILRSRRFRDAFSKLASDFEWTVVDSTPMLPIVDVNLWSRLLDGTLLVVREGVTPVKALKRGLQALDHPKLLGVVVNEASEGDPAGYEGHFYGSSDRHEHAAGKLK